MRTWPVPPDLQGAEEKFLGPLNAKQFFYVVAGFVLGCVAALALPLPPALRACAFAVGQGAGAALAVARPCGMDAGVFLWRLWRWWRSPRGLFLKGGD